PCGQGRTRRAAMTTAERGVAGGVDPAAGMYIVDGDSHVLEPPHLWEEYLEEEFRPRAIRITRPVAAPAPPEPPGGMPEMAEEVRQRLASDEALVVDNQVVMKGFLAGLGGVEHDRAKLPQMTYLDGAPKASMD